MRNLAAVLALALLAATALPLIAGSQADAQSKCTRVYTTSGWITRC